jgi:hypothetical protein
MRRGEQRVVISVVGLLAGAGIALAASGRERSLAVFPPQNIPLRFNHAVHLEAGADCTTCHDAARKSTKASDRNLPKHPECEVCHDIQAAARGKKVDPPASCNYCHPGFDPTVQITPAPIDLPTPNLKFNHKVHVDRKIECTTCHGKMRDVTLATRMQLPKMVTCLDCHDGSQASSACTTCHLERAPGRLQLAFASGALRPMQGNPFGLDHGPRFEFNHGTRASTDRQTCMQCHAESECQQCHNSLQKPLSIHPNDYITTHPLQARIDSPRCEGCHRLQSFCAACHERTGVGLNADPSFRSRNVRVHPNYDQWVSCATGASCPQHHGIAASRDIRQCISCHREETCLVCHAERNRFPAGFQAQVNNPHPDGFAQSCRSPASKNSRACLKCHTDASLASRGCR